MLLALFNEDLCLNEECSLKPGSGKAASGSEQAQPIVQVELPREQSPSDTDCCATWGIAAWSEQFPSAGAASSCSGKPSTRNCYLTLFSFGNWNHCHADEETGNPEVELVSSWVAWSAPGQLMVSPWSAPEEQSRPFPGLPSVVGGSRSPCAHVSLRLQQGWDRGRMVSPIHFTDVVQQKKTKQPPWTNGLGCT